MPPTTRLGRWCGPWYATKCDTMLKGWLNDHDHSAWPHAPVETKKFPRDARPTSPPKAIERDPISALLAQWHEG